MTLMNVMTAKGELMCDDRGDRCSIVRRNWRGIALVLLMVAACGATSATNQAMDRAAEVRSLERAVLLNPFDLTKLDRLGELREADRLAYIKAIEALGDGLEAVLKDDHERAAAKLYEAKSVARVRELARGELGIELWRVLGGEDGLDQGDAPAGGEQDPITDQAPLRVRLNDLVNLCPVCGHTGLMDCQRCRGDGFYRGETCPQCEGAGVEACTHSIHAQQGDGRDGSDAHRGLTAEQRSRVERLIQIVRYLSAGGVDWFSAGALARSPRIGEGR